MMRVRPLRGEYAINEVKVRTEEEIRQVYEGDIARLTGRVVDRYGAGVLYEGLAGMRVEGVYPEEFTELCADTDTADCLPPALSKALYGDR